MQLHCTHCGYSRGLAHTEINWLRISTSTAHDVKLTAVSSATIAATVVTSDGQTLSAVSAQFRAVIQHHCVCVWGCVGVCVCVGRVCVGGRGGSTSVSVL